MNFQNKIINGSNKKVLEVIILDNEDIEEVKRKYVLCECVMLDLSSLEYLKLFKCIDTLILTGGIPTDKGMKCLYLQKEIENLILDYEETDNDSEGIDLNKFPKLKYVLSRSNLNICEGQQAISDEIQMEVLNYYKDGKPLKVKYASNYDLFQEKRFCFFSTEANHLVSATIINILKKFEDMLSEQYSDIIFSNNLDSIGIIVICMPDDMLAQGYGKERRLVSLKKRYADVRLQITYSDFLDADRNQQLHMCKNIIEEAAKYIYKKDKTFMFVQFVNAINNIAEIL